MIEKRRAQLSFGDGLIAEEVSDLREAWMAHADEVLSDEPIVATVYEALARRHPKSRSRGRPGTPAEVVLRLLVLKHVRNWSYAVLEREVRANLVYRDFTRVGAAKMPDGKTMGRWGTALGPAVIKQIHARIIELAQAEDIVQGRRMRVDTTVVETNIHYPTDSSLLGDGVRVLTRTMKKITTLAGTVEVSEALCIGSSWPAGFWCQRADAASRSPNSIANWFSAAVHSRVDRFHPFLMLRSARYSNLVAASSLGNEPRVLMILRSVMCRLSMAFVV